MYENEFRKSLMIENAQFMKVKKFCEIEKGV